MTFRKVEKKKAQAFYYVTDSYLSIQNNNYY